MIAAHFITAFIIALILSAMLLLIFKAETTWNRFWALLLILTFAAWVGGLWIMPFGPAVWGIYILPFILMALLFGLILAAAGPMQPHQYREEPYYTQEELRGRAGSKEALTIYFWTLLVFLLALVVLRYAFSG